MNQNVVTATAADHLFGPISGDLFSHTIPVDDRPVFIHQVEAVEDVFDQRSVIDIHSTSFVQRLEQ
jgi:hypothetical protein